MAFLPNFNQLGSLELIEVYEFYDKPLLVLACNELDHRYLGVLIEDTLDRENWYFVGLSERRLHHVRSGFIDLYTAFADPESGQIFNVSVPGDQQVLATISSIDRQDIDVQILPEKGEVLELQTVTIPRLSEDLVRKAMQAKRIYLRLRFEFENQLRTEAPAKYLGEVLCSVQDLMNAIGQSIKEIATERGIIPRNIIQNNEFAVSTFGGGSFEVELASLQLVDLLDQADIARSVEELSALIEIGSDADRLREKLQELKVRVSANYLKFLQAIVKNTRETEIAWATPIERKHGLVKISSLTAKVAATVIQMGEIQEPDQFSVIGSLVGANLRSKTYEIIVSDQEKYGGKIPEDFVNGIRGAVLGQTYVATIKRIRTIHPSTGKEELHHELLSLKTVNRLS